MKVLVTGGAGYIGSHTVVELCARGHEAVIVDNFGNSSREILPRLAKITGRGLKCFELDATDAKALERVVGQVKPDAVMHFAGFKAVAESVARPLEYYRNNLGSAIAVCQAMREHGVRRLIFSSSATVYNEDAAPPWDEAVPAGTHIANPYGRSKYMIEQILRDLAASEPGWALVALRYFNPVGAHDSGLIGEDPRGQPNNLMPMIAQVAVGRRRELGIFGGDYDTPDGTPQRDYIHVMDVARGHVAALERLRPARELEVFNLGSGRPVSVLELVRAFERASGKRVRYRIAARRPGDLAVYYADPGKARKELGWAAERTIEQACADAWRWQSRNPRGFED